MMVKLRFELVCECNPEDADELGESISQDLLNSWDNGEDILEWNYVDYKVILMSHYDDMIFDLMHISKREYDFITQRNSDLEIHTDCLIRENNELKKENKKLREDNVVLRDEIKELYEVIRNKNNEIDELNGIIRNKNDEFGTLKDSVRIVVDFKCGDDDE